MTQRLALGVTPGTGWRAAEIRTVAQHAEAAGYEAIFGTEVNTDVLAVAALIADATGGRMVLGLGVGHGPINAALGLDMPSPINTLRHYTTEVAGWLRGEGPVAHLSQQAAAVPVPLYLGAMNSSTVELAGELADGVMPFLWSAERIARSAAWRARGRAKATAFGELEVALGLPVFIGDNVPAMIDTARRNLGPYTRLPFFQNLLRFSGFVSEAENAERGAGAAALTDTFLDAVCLIGPVERCRARLAVFTAAGADLPILVPPAGVDGARSVIDALKP